MSTVARLAAFAALLAVVVAAAAFAGAAADPDPETARGGSHTTDAPDPHGAEPEAGGHAGGRASEAPAVKGLAVTNSGYTLALAERELPAGRATRLQFRILQQDGSPLRRYTVEHERRMHLIVVRRDGTGFQHLHPRIALDGTWTTTIRFAQPGSYRVFADFKTGDSAVTLGGDLAVDGEARYRPLPAPAEVDRTGAFQVMLQDGGARAGRDATLRFTVLRDGQTVHTQPYLGAGGHLVALREGDLAYLHTHPADDHGDEGEKAHDDSVPFETGFPTAGRYRLYFQFKVDGRIHTAQFTREVTR